MGWSRVVGEESTRPLDRTVVRSVRSAVILLAAFAAICFLLVQATGHRVSWGGSIISDRGTPGSDPRPCYVLQYRSSQRGDDEPGFAIIWLAHWLGKADDDLGIGGKLNIHGKLLRVPDYSMAVYALRPDYSLEKLPLTEQEFSRLFHLMEGRLTPYKRAIPSGRRRLVRTFLSLSGSRERGVGVPRMLSSAGPVRCQRGTELTEACYMGRKVERCFFLFDDEKRAITSCTDDS